ncbi:MAG: TraR/DksA family transcriptional regulator [Myxococcales bacterium]
MNAAQRKKYAQLLEELRTELTKKGTTRIEPNRNSEAEVGGDEDEQPLNEMLQSIASSRNRNSAMLLGLIARALKKLKDEPDEYGVCEECGEDIGSGRLKAMPYAPLCVSCQGKKDAPKGSPTRRKLTDYR